MTADDPTEPYMAAADEREAKMLLRATAQLLNIANQYFLSPPGSRAEAEGEAELDAVLATLLASQDKTKDMIASLLSLIVGLQQGMNIEEYFAPAGIKAVSMPLAEAFPAKDPSDD